MATSFAGREGNFDSIPRGDSSKPAVSGNLVVTVAAGYREEQIRPFLASLRNFAPGISLNLIVGRHDPEFEEAVRAWFPGCSFHLLPPAPLRDFALKRKWARSIFKRLARWSGSRSLGKKLLTITFLRHIVVRDLLAAWNLRDAKILFCDSRDVVFQGDPFSGEWPVMRTCEEDKLIGECSFNAPAIKRAAGEAAFQQAKHCRVVCAGVMGGRAEQMARYFQHSAKIVEQIAPKIALTIGDQGIHNYLVRLRPELGFTVLPNGHLAANLAYTRPEDLAVSAQEVRVRNHPEAPAILHQYDRHPDVATVIQSKWAGAKPPA